MAYNFIFPDVGEGIHEGEVIQWKVKEGERVKADQVIAEVQTDKALVEIPAPISGVMLKLSVPEGKTIRVGELFCVIGEEGEKVDSKTQETTGKLASAEKQANVKPPEKKEELKAVNVSQRRPVLATARLGIIATPRTRQLARSLGIDISIVHGTGQGGRITETDVREFQQAGKTPENAQPQQIISPQQPTQGVTKQIPKVVPKVTFEKWGSVLRIPLKGIRKATAEHMMRAWATIPHVTHMDEADVTELVGRRNKEKKEAEKRGFKLTFLPFITKAVIAALHTNPYFNSSIDADEIVVKKYYNMGIAVDTSNGLMVPNVKNADKLSILELAREMQTLAEKCRDKTITLDEMQGGTFTITNVGSFGGVMATPLVNYPEAAILGIGAIREKPVVRNGKIAIRKIMPLFLSFDHRVVDGAAAARCMNDIIHHLEDPDLMLVDVV